jgi:hypothetical protein
MFAVFNFRHKNYDYTLETSGIFQILTSALFWDIRCVITQKSADLNIAAEA